MDVIINNAASSAQPMGQAAQYQAAQYPVQSQPAPYGNGYEGPQEHGFGGGFLLIAAVVGGFILLKARRRRAWMMHRMGMGGPGMAAAGMGGPRPFGPGMGAGQPPQGQGDWKDTLQRGRERLFGDGALDIARERYARGEISAEQYGQLQRGLSGQPTQASTHADSAPEAGAPGNAQKPDLHKDGME